MDILIVEDSVRERERLQTLFVDLGYSVQGCDSVDEAEQLLKNDAVRCSIIDIGLTYRSGSVLFQSIQSSHPNSEIIIFTGNPSPFLKQRFLREGATAYIVKGSEGASNDSFQRLIEDTIGLPSSSDDIVGFSLSDFLRQYIPSEQQSLFLDENNEFPPCLECGSRDYLISFSHEIQLPPTVSGSVYCEQCQTALDPTLSDGDE